MAMLRQPSHGPDLIGEPAHDSLAIGADPQHLHRYIPTGVSVTCPPQHGGPAHTDRFAEAEVRGQVGGPKCSGGSDRCSVDDAGALLGDRAGAVGSLHHLTLTARVDTAAVPLVPNLAATMGGRGPNPSPFQRSDTQR